MNIKREKTFTSTALCVYFKCALYKAMHIHNTYYISEMLIALEIVRFFELCNGKHQDLMCHWNGAK